MPQTALTGFVVMYLSVAVLCLGCHDLEAFPSELTHDAPAHDAPAHDAPAHDLALDRPLEADLPAPDVASLDLTTDTSSTPGCGAAICTIPAGSFMMGSPSTDPCREVDEDYHMVTLSAAFEIGRTEVTQKAFKAITNYNPSSFTSCGLDCPVENLSWSEAASYCNTLSLNAKLGECYDCKGSGAQAACSTAAAYTGASTIYTCPGYRLCTDAELEYAQRAGTTTSTYAGVITKSGCSGSPTAATSIAWFDKNASSKTHVVKGKDPNAWGLWDMAGNVWEWSHDLYSKSLGITPQKDPVGTSGTQRVVRGGSWKNPAAFMRSATRGNNLPTKPINILGFRICKRH